MPLEAKPDEQRDGALSVRLNMQKVLKLLSATIVATALFGVVDSWNHNRGIGWINLIIAVLAASCLVILLRSGQNENKS